MVDHERWWRLLEGLLDFYADDVVGEREAVLHYTQLHRLLTGAVQTYRNGDDP